MCMKDDEFWTVVYGFAALADIFLRFSAGAIVGGLIGWWFL